MISASVIMSAYNETTEQLNSSVQSILEQSYRDFELIIVCDNPNNSRLVKDLEELTQKDERIKIIWNDENCGLAVSMNKAAEQSIGEYLIRMDADDICTPDRFEKEINLMYSKGFDLICSSFYYIDDNDLIIGENTKTYSDNEILQLLPLRNIVHHPTVVMKRSIFFEVGGYRDFPCAQDYDLWLRLIERGFSIHMLNEKLLYYRIRTDSVTSTRKYKQLVTLNYIRSLYHIRLRVGVDPFSKEHYTHYLEIKGVGNIIKENCYHEGESFKAIAEKYRLEKRYFMAMFFAFKCAYASEFHRNNLVLKLRRLLLNNRLKLN